MEIPAGFEFHHLGQACRAIEREIGFVERLGYRRDGKAFEDSVQGIRGQFMVGAGPRLELLEDLPGRDTLGPWLDAGIRIYHMAYMVDDLGPAIEWGRGQRGKLIVPPVPAVAFKYHAICFMMFPNRSMLEFILHGPTV